MVGKGGDVKLFKVIVFLFGWDVFAGHHFDEGGIGFAEGEGIAVNHHLHRVAERGEFHQFDDGIGDETHVQEMLSARAFSVDGLDLGGLSDSQFIEGSHICFCLKLQK